MIEDFDQFLENWISITTIWAKIAIGLAGIVLVFYFLLLLTKRNLVKKHQFIGTNEIKYLGFCPAEKTASLSAGKGNTQDCRQGKDHCGCQGPLCNKQEY